MKIIPHDECFSANYWSFVYGMRDGWSDNEDDCAATDDNILEDSDH